MIRPRPLEKIQDRALLCFAFLSVSFYLGWSCAGEFVDIKNSQSSVVFGIPTKASSFLPRVSRLFPLSRPIFGLWTALFRLVTVSRQKRDMEFEYQEEYIRNSRDVQLFTCRWLPLSPPKALVFLCHGYGMECSGFMRGVGITLACAGYAVIGMDYEGHGRSRGARCYIKRFDYIINDCYDFFKSVSEQDEYGDKKRFLYGESMGGAVSLLLHKKYPDFWHGAVLVAPMCKISEKVKPHPVVVNILTRVEEIIPKWKIVPTKDVIDSAFKDPLKREEIRRNSLIYQEKPRLKTALEMLRTSINLEHSLNEIRLPFFVLHGEADIVTDPEVSRALYEKASSVDKTIKLYPGMWHGLTSGEPDDNIEIVFIDIIDWLDKRCSDAGEKPFYPHHGTPLVKFAPATPLSSMEDVGGKKLRQQRPRLYGKYLCGWKGRGAHPRSSM